MKTSRVSFSSRVPSCGVVYISLLWNLAMPCVCKRREVKVGGQFGLGHSKISTIDSIDFVETKISNVLFGMI